MNVGLTRQRIDHIGQRYAASDALLQGFNNFFVLAQSLDFQTAKRSAVVLVHDDVLSHVVETTGQVTRVSRLQGRIRKTLTGTVRRNEVLQDGQTLLKVGDNRVFDNLTA